MQVHYITRLVSTQYFKTVGRTLSTHASSAFRRLKQPHYAQTIVSLRSSSLLRYASTNSSSDEKNQNKTQEESMTNLMYIFGGLTGVIAIYSLFDSRNDSKVKKPTVVEYDNKIINKQNKDSDDANKTIVENLKTDEMPKLLAEEEDQDLVENMNANDIMPNIPNFAQYLIIGGGTTAMSAFKSIRENDPTAKVLVISSESYLPYMRPPLSKDVWYTHDDDLIQKHSFRQWNGNEKSLYFYDKEFYTDVKTLNDQETGGVAVVFGRKVVDLDLKKSVAKLDNDWEILFEKCLIATGGQPKTLKIFETAMNHLKTKLTFYRGIDDFFKLKNIVDSGANVAIVGGGFLGSELACALAYRTKENGKNGKPNGKIMQLMTEKGNINKVLPEYLSKWTLERVREEGADVLGNIELVDASVQEGKVILSYIDPNERRKTSYVTADHIVIAVGIEPNTDLAKSAGLEIDSNQGGFVVNSELQARHNVWVAGDAASFYDIKLGRRRVEHYDHAIVSGKVAGENMTGAHKPYWHQSMFWCDLGPNIGFEAIGLTDSRLQTVAIYAKRNVTDEGQQEDSEGNRVQKDIISTSNSDTLQHKTSETKADIDNKEDYNKGVVFYVREDRVVGIVLWNVFNRIPIARKIIKDQQVITDFQELAKLFNIHQD